MNSATDSTNTFIDPPSPESPSPGSRSDGAGALRFNLFAFAALIAVNLFCYYRTINGYFLADDFVHVAYLFKVFSGHPELLLENFVTNWMQAEGTQFYRPLISITLAFDYSLWGANATGYHITNLLYQTVSSILLFLVCLRLFAPSDRIENKTMAFGAALLFAACPLHPEVVSWIIARVDSVATTFYLAAFWFFLLFAQSENPKRRHLYLAASIVTFSLSLLSKEMAITLPATITVWSLLSDNRPGGLWQRVKSALIQTWPFWAALAIYLGLRTAVLGTFSGGYAGSIGEGMSNSLVKRWFYDNSFARVLYPFNDELFSPGDRMRKHLKLLYQLAAVVFFVRIFHCALERNLVDYFRRTAFAAIWFVLAMVPTYQVWNLTQSLQGSRFIYLGTAPLCLLLSVILLPALVEKPKPATSQSRITWNQWLRCLSALLLGTFIFYFANMTYRNNTCWVYAGKGVKALREAIVGVLDKMPAHKKMILLNLPQRYAGAHMLYNASTMGVLLQRPLCDKDYAERVVTFEPMTYGDSDLIIVSRLRRLLRDSERYGVYRWDDKRHELIELNLSLPHSEPISLDAGLPSKAIDGEHLLASQPVDLPASAVDFIEIAVKTEPKSPPGTDRGYLELWWTTQADPFFNAQRRLAKPLTEKTGSYIFCVSQYKKWIMSGAIQQLAVSVTPAPYTVQVDSFKVKDGSAEIPSLSPVKGSRNEIQRTMDEDNMGVSRPGAIFGKFRYDASKIPSAVKVIYEISKPDSWFEHYSGELRDKERSKETSITGELPGLKSESYSIVADKLKQPGFYELRIIAEDKDGKVVGYASDPINLQVGSEDLRKKGRRP